MTLQKFRKKPIIVEAVQFTGSWENAEKIAEWITNTWEELDTEWDNDVD